MRFRVHSSWQRNLRELFLIVAGVLIALGANSYWQERQDRAAERRILQEMRSTIAADLVSLRGDQKELQRIETNIVRLRAMLEKAPPYADSLDAYFGGAFMTGAYTLPNAAIYEALKVRGLDLVSDDSLRFEIPRVYETAYGWLRMANEFNTTTTLQVLRPYYLTHFSHVRFSQNATPLDYSAVIHDPYFDNILYYREDTLRRTILPIYALGILRDSALLVGLDRQLARLR